MRLLRPEADGSLSLCERYNREIPPYAILSHVWGADFEEVTYADLTEGRGGDKKGYQKLDFCRKQLHVMAYGTFGSTLAALISRAVQSRRKLSTPCGNGMRKQYMMPRFEVYADEI
jgi:hypothetical protein